MATLQHKEIFMEQGWDPEVKRYFRKIISTISYGLLWLIAVVAGGIYYKLGWQGDKPLIYTILFYGVAVFSFILLLLFYIRLWKK